MKLLTKKLENSLPPLYATENIPAGDKTAIVKYFNSWGDSRWYGVEYDPDERVFFGYVRNGSGESEWGYFSLTEMEGLPMIERDLYFEPTQMRFLIEGI